MLATHFGAGVPVSRAGMSTVRRLGEVKPLRRVHDAGVSAVLTKLRYLGAPAYTATQPR